MKFIDDNGRLWENSDLEDIASHIQPTIGQNIVPLRNAVKIKNGSVVIREVGGSMEELFLTACESASCIIFVIDSIKQNVLTLFRTILSNSHVLQLPILLVLSKSDEISTFSLESLQNFLVNIGEIDIIVKWIRVSAITGEGVREILEWMNRVLSSFPHLS